MALTDKDRERLAAISRRQMARARGETDEPDEVKRAMWLSRGNVQGAARRLGMSTAGLKARLAFAKHRAKWANPGPLK